MGRLDRERERVLREDARMVTVRDVPGLLGEVDYLRGQVEAETAHASELLRQLVRAGVREGASENV